MNKKGKSRVFDVAYTEPGLFRINVSAFGETLSGREFRLVVPEFSFNIEVISEDLLEMVDGKVVVDEEGKPLKRKILSKEEKAAELALNLEQARIEYQEKEAQKQQETLIAIAVANFVIIFVAFIAYLAIRWRRNKLKRK